VREQRQVSRQNLRRHVHHRPGVDLAVDAEKRNAAPGGRRRPCRSGRHDRGRTTSSATICRSLRPAPTRDTLGVDRGAARHHARQAGARRLSRGREQDLAAGTRRPAPAPTPPGARRRRGKTRDDGGLERGARPQPGNQRDRPGRRPTAPTVFAA
jgi:hypothetical protein